MLINSGFALRACYLLLLQLAECISIWVMLKLPRL